MEESMLDDWQIGRNARHTIMGLLGQSALSCLAGHEDTNDADRTSIGQLDGTVRGRGIEAKNL